MESNIFWKQLSKKPQIFIFDSFQMYSNSELYDTFLDQILGKLMSNSIPDSQKSKLFDKLLNYLGSVAEKNNREDIIKILHSNIKIFSIANIGIQAGVYQFKKDLIIETIIPLFEGFFDKRLGSKENWCVYKDNYFNFSSLIKCCIMLSKENGLDELIKLVCILTINLDQFHLNYTYSFAVNFFKIFKNNSNESEEKMKYLLSCLGCFYELDESKRKEMLDYVEFYLNNPLIAAMHIANIFCFYDVIKTNIMISEKLSPLSKCFYVLGIFLMDTIEKTAFMDYSVTSMQFYKVIENELKDKFIKPVFCNINFEKMNEKPFKTIKNIDSITLGNIRYIFEWLLQNWENNEFLNSDLKQIKDKLKIKFNSERRYIEEINVLLSQDNLNKYRNPPAHAKTLEFDEATEAHHACVLFLHLAVSVQENIDFVSFINKENTPFLF